MSDRIYTRTSDSVRALILHLEISNYISGFNSSGT